MALGPFSSDVLIGGGNSGTDCVRRRSCAEYGATEVEEAERGRFRDRGVDEGDGDGDGAGEGGVQVERALASGDAVNDGDSFSNDSGRVLRVCGAAGCCGSAVVVGRDGA